MAPVEIIFRTILWAVPAFMRDDPARTSGPTSVTMAKCGGALERRVAIAGEGDGVGAAAAGVFDGGDGEGSASAGGDAEDDVVLAGLALFHFGDGGGGVVFAGFGGVGEGLGASGHDELHGARVGVESGRDFGGVEGAEAAAGSGADVDEASAVADAGGDDVDGAGDLRQGAADGGGDGGVFVVHQAGDFEGGFVVEIVRRRCDLLGEQDAEIGSVACGFAVKSNRSLLSLERPVRKIAHFSRREALREMGHSGVL